MDRAAFKPGGMFRRAGLARSAAVVTALGASAQILGLGTQAIIAGAFGAHAEMDAFLAANTLPQYVVTVLLGALVVVFVPVFIDYDGRGRSADAWHVASAVVTAAGLLLAGLATVGLLLAGPLIRLSTPGLSPESLALATQVARITWPSIAASGIVGLITGIYHASGRFAWPALVPVLGTALNLALVAPLAQSFGVSGVAIAAVAGLTLQALLLLRGVTGRGRLQFSLDWSHPGVIRIVSLLWPLMLSGLLIRYTPVVDRYLASGLAEGSISHLGYAFKVVTILSMFLSTGIATVVFPRMALNIAMCDMQAMRATVSLALRVMWLGVAPLIAIGFVLAQPVVALLFERGAFVARDTAAVAALLGIYLLSLCGACLGSVTGRAFYALKQTRTLAVMGVLEAIAYAAYTAALAASFGARGVAVAYVAYHSLSVMWHLPLLRWRLGRRGGAGLFTSFLRTGAAALFGSLAAAQAMAMASRPWIQFTVGAGSGIAAYVGAMCLWGGPESRSAPSVVAVVIRRGWGGKMDDGKQVRSSVAVSSSAP